MVESVGKGEAASVSPGLTGHPCFPLSQQCHRLNGEPWHHICRGRQLCESRSLIISQAKHVGCRDRPERIVMLFKKRTLVSLRRTFLQCYYKRIPVIEGGANAVTTAFQRHLDQNAMR